MANSNIKNVQTSGFYYDAQLSNPLLTATLHTNTYIANWVQNPSNQDPYDMGEQFDWRLWNPVSDKKEENIAAGDTVCLDKITDNYSDAYPRNPSACYREKPLITAILNEDFMVQVGNSWGDAGGMSSLEQTFNQMKSAAAYHKEIGAGISEISKAITPYLNGNGFLSKAGKWVNDNLLSKVTGDGKPTDRLNSALITQGSRFSYYGGTQTTFQNLTMRFTLFADWVYDDRVNDVVFKTVHEQLREIYPYAIGKYDPVDASGVLNKIKTDTGWVRKSLDKTNEVISTFFGWQSPPAGFQADVRSLDTCQKGTLRLVLGGYYTAENLLIDGMSVNFSKTMTKIPPNSKKLQTEGKYRYEYYTDERAGIEYDDEGNEIGYAGEYVLDHLSHYSTIDTEGGLTPLYADVTINLRPATNYSDNAIIHFSSNKGLGKIEQDIASLRNQKLGKEIIKKREKESDLFKNYQAEQKYLKEKGVKTPEELIQNDPSLNPDLNSGLLDLEPPAQEGSLNNLVTPSPPAGMDFFEDMYGFGK